MRVWIPSSLRGHTRGESSVWAEGETLGELLANLDVDYPGLHLRILDEQGRIREHIKIFVNRVQEYGLGVSLDEADEVHLICAPGPA